MDPVTQSALGASLAQTQSNSNKVWAAAILGCIGGLAPDLDVLISSSEDPLLFLEYHRQFTHSLIFIPFGSLLVSLFCWKLFKHGLNFQRSVLILFSWLRNSWFIRRLHYLWNSAAVAVF